jgi:hypothetical protein
MAGYEWYKTGTVIVRNGEREVVGANTDWLVNDIKQGDIFTAGGQIYEIAEVIGNTSLTLCKPYRGESDGAAEYAIIQRAGEVIQAELALKLQQAITMFNTRDQVLTELEERTRFLAGLELSIDTDGDWSNTDAVHAAEVLTSSLPIASRTQAGVVRIGNNIDVTPEGTISADVDKELIQESFDKVAATSGDVQAMIEEVYGDTGS